METLHLDLAQTATRQHIRDVLFAQLNEEQRATVLEALEGIAWESDHFHNVGEVKAAIGSTDLDERVRNDACAIYDILAQAEAHVHGVPVEQTHFHEVGDAEAVRNVLAVCLAIDQLAPAKITATPVQTGSGKVKCAHGLLDIPAPATAAILARGIPVCADTVEGEQCTPTSAAIIAHFVEEFDR
ncbi:MAG: nickel insertion protein [Eggerthellaceae bacterium]|jgi:uncharacterized protein (DUF111 family)